MFVFHKTFCVIISWVRIDQRVGYESTRGLGTNRPKVGTKHLSLGTERLGKKRPWVRNDWIP